MTRPTGNALVLTTDDEHRWTDCAITGSGRVAKVAGQRAPDARSCHNQWHQVATSHRRKHPLCVE